MVTTLYGPDSYRRLRKLNELVNFFVRRRGAYSHERLQLEDEEGFYRLKNFLSTSSMFGPKKLLILDDPFEYPDIKSLKEVLRRNTETQDINIIINTEKKFSLPFKFLTDPPNVYYEFSKLEGQELGGFIKSEAAKLGIKLAPAGIVQIGEALGPDTWRIATELERLSLAKTARLESAEAKINYFSNLNDIKKGKTVKQRLVALEKLMSGARYDAERLFNGLAFRLSSETEAEMYADYNAATRAGRLDYEEALVAVALGLQFDPLNQ